MYYNIIIHMGTVYPNLTMKPKNIILSLLLTVLILLAAKTSYAQVKTTITGVVVDSISQKLVDYITVNLKTNNNMSVKVAVTKPDGSFTFIGVQPGKYIITMVAVGYQKKNINIDVKQNTNLGAIIISPTSNNLKEVSIKADKPIVKQEIDRISYDLQADPESKVNSVLEMLRKVPYVSLDADDNILLKGNTSYKIFINGKPSSMMERDPKSILRSMPASTIQRIEIITIPPSKYDAEGLAGIINIITNKKVDEGYNGTLNANYRYPNGPGLGTSFTVKEGKLGINGYGGGSIYNIPQTDNLNTRVTTGSSPTNLVQQGNNSSDSRSAYFGTEISYEIDSLKLISAQFNINGNRSTGDSYQATLLTGPFIPSQNYNLTNASNGKGNGVDASVNYQLGFKANKNQLLTFSYRYYDYTNKSFAGLSSQTIPGYNQDNNAFFSEQTIQADYVQPLKKVNFEAGIKAIFRNNSSNFQYDTLNVVTGRYGLKPAFSNNFNNTQDILAAYNTWQYGGKGWGIKVGLRMEQTITDANFLSSASTVHQNYFNVVPSVAFNMDFKDRSGINFGYTQRLQRPGINRLNPFVDRSNPNFETSGNPNLGPTVINDFQLGYHISKKAQLNIGLTYDFAKSLVLLVSNFDPATNITNSTYQNIGKATGVGTNINFNYPITQKWNFSLNANMMYFWLTGEVDGVLQTNRFLTESISASTGYVLGNGWRATVSLNTNGRNPTGLQGSSNGWASTSYSINKEVVKNKLTFSAGMNNPFTKYRYNITETSGNDFTQNITNQVYFRSYRVSLNYSFGKLKSNIKKAKRGINNDDVAK